MPVEVIVDVTAVFSTRGELDYLPASPVLLLDTRPSRVAAGGQTQFVVPQAELPTRAVSVNVTAVLHDADGYTTLFNCGTTPPSFPSAQK